jgi:pseudouridine-5'-phosphate glycosidase
MLACDLAGIEVFATGGIGGVHPGAGEHFDISSDLTALSTFRVSVISAGAKSILDLAATLEALETRGVPVVGYGTDRFPAFHVPRTELALDARVDTPDGAAAVIRAHRANPHAAGLLLANPIPERDALPAELIREATARAERDARAEGVRGRALTPFLLARLEHHTGTRSLEANVALLRNNAEVGAAVARALAG